MQRYRDAIRVLRGVSRYAYDVLETYCFEERPVALRAMRIWRRASTPWRTTGE